MGTGEMRGISSPCWEGGCPDIPDPRDGMVLILKWRSDALSPKSSNRLYGYRRRAGAGENGDGGGGNGHLQFNNNNDINILYIKPYHPIDDNAIDGGLGTAGTATTGNYNLIII